MPQIKITLTEENYKWIKKEAENSYRTISNQLNYILDQLKDPSHLSITPMFIPHDTPGGMTTK